MLAFSVDGRHYYGRVEIAESQVRENVVWARWQPLSSVEETWLVPLPPWHVRIHRIVALNRVYTAEGGFALARTQETGELLYGDGAGVVIRTPAATSGIFSLAGLRDARVIDSQPNTNVVAPRTQVLVLTGMLPGGVHRYVTAVLGTVQSCQGEPVRGAPSIAALADGYVDLNYGTRRIRVLLSRNEHDGV